MDKTGIMTSVVLVAVLLGAFAMGDAHGPGQSPATPPPSGAELNTGAVAPGFALPALSSPDTVTLSAITARQPVVLVFNSYASEQLRRNVGRLGDIYREYRDDVQFYVICSHDKPPYNDGPLKADACDKEIPAGPPSPEAHRAGAAQLVDETSLIVPVLIDLEDSASRAYHAHPGRLFIIDKGGLIRYASAQGSLGDQLDELSDVLARLMMDSNPDHTR